jgi:plasmid stabilization system protein ParE
MHYVVKITAKALGEIDEAMEWRARHSIPRAVRWYLELKDAIGSLADDADQWPEAPESEWYPGICERIFGKKRGIYRILFEIRGNTVYVLRIRHGAQNLLGPNDL